MAPPVVNADRRSRVADTSYGMDDVAVLPRSLSARAGDRLVAPSGEAVLQSRPWGGYSLQDGCCGAQLSTRAGDQLVAPSGEAVLQSRPWGGYSLQDGCCGAQLSTRAGDQLVAPSGEVVLQSRSRGWLLPAGRVLWR